MNTTEGNRRAEKSAATKARRTWVDVLERRMGVRQADLMPVGKRIASRFMLVFLPVAALLMTFVFSRYLKPLGGGDRNAGSVDTADLLVPLLLAILTAAAIALVNGMVSLKWGGYRTALLASFLAAIVTNSFTTRYDTLLPIVKSFLPLSFTTIGVYWLLIIVILLGVCYLVAHVILRCIKPWSTVHKNAATVLVVLAGYLFVVNVLPVLSYNRSVARQRNYRPVQLAAEIPNNAAAAAKPDVYYIVLDRYTNTNVLREYLGFDNSAFTGYLRSQGFYVRDDAYANYPYTAMSIGSTMSATYLDDIEKQFGEARNQTNTVLFNLTRYSAVAQEFKDLGYTYEMVGSWFGSTNKAPLADTFHMEYGRLEALGKTTRLEDFDGNIMYESPFAPLFREGVSLPFLDNNIVKYSNQGPVDLTRYQLKQLQEIAAAPSGGRFVFAHMLMPHDPYVFNADGSVSIVDSGSNDNGKTLYRKYTDQVEFINREMQSLIATIKEKSGGTAIIVLQADEGFYPFYFYKDSSFNGGSVVIDVMSGDMRTWPDKYLQTKYGILAAYHLPGATEEELRTQVNSANIFRFIFNRYFGYQLPTLPNCQFAFDKGRGRPLSYTDITNRFNQSPDPRCSSVHD